MADRIITAGSSSVILEVELRATSDGQLYTGLSDAAIGSVYYQRDEAAARVEVNLATGTLGTYVADQSFGTGSWIETQMAGVYQLCLPNAAFAAGARGVSISMQYSGVVDRILYVQLLEFDLFSDRPGVVTVMAPAASNSVMNLVEGDDYESDRITISAAWDGEDIEGATATMNIQPMTDYNAQNDANITEDVGTLTIGAATDSVYPIGVVLTAAETAEMTEQVYKYEIKATVSTRVHTIVLGTINVSPQVTTGE